jgi:hypothetical protein
MCYANENPSGSGSQSADPEFWHSLVRELHIIIQNSHTAQTISTHHVLMDDPRKTVRVVKLLILKFDVCCQGSYL